MVVRASDLERARDAMSRARDAARWRLRLSCTTARRRGRPSIRDAAARIAAGGSAVGSPRRAATSTSPTRSRATGPLDLVLVPGSSRTSSTTGRTRSSARLLERLGSFCRLIRFDKRGTGLSDRPGGLPDLETRMDDVRAVMDAVGSERAALFGYSEGGPMASLFAATYPAADRALVLYGTYAKRSDPEPDYPWAPTWEQRAGYAAEVERTGARRPTWARWRPSADERSSSWWHGACAGVGQPRRRARPDPDEQPDRRTPRAADRAGADARPAPHAATATARVDEGRYIAAHIPGARFVELPGDDHVPYVGPGRDRRRDRGVPHRRSTAAPETDRVLATVALHRHRRVDRARGALGDRAWAELLEQAPPARATRAGAVRRRGDRHRRRRLPRALRRPGPRDPLRAGDPRRRADARARAARRRPHRRGRAAASDRSPRGIAVHIGARVAAAGRRGRGPCFGRPSATSSPARASLRGPRRRQLKGIGPRRLYAATA